MRTIWKWLLGILGALIVLGIIASAFFVRFFWQMPMMAGQRGFVPRNFPGPGAQRLPPMFGGMDGFGRMGMGFRGGGLFYFLPHLLFQLLILGLVVAGVIFLVRALSRPRAGAPGGMQVAAAAPGAASVPVAAAVIPPAPLETVATEPAPVRTCVSCGRQLQADWTHCPHCGTPVQSGI
jgi:hypothetical protein